MVVMVSWVCTYIPQLIELYPLNMNSCLHINNTSIKRFIELDPEIDQEQKFDRSRHLKISETEIIKCRI